MLVNLPCGATLAPRQALIHSGTKLWLCVLKFLRENVLQAAGEHMNAGNPSPSVAQCPGKTVGWHLEAHP